MKVSCHTYNNQFRYPFTISKGTKTHQPGILVALEHFGVTGYGEAPAINYYNISVEKMVNDLERKKQFVEKFAFTTPERYWHYLHHLIPANPFLVCALDMAAWDMYGKLKRKKLHELFKADVEQMPLSDYTIGIDTIAKMVEKIKEQPWPVYKIKVGTDADLEMIKNLREHTDAPFRVDANAAWEKEEALEKINILKGYNVELVEQPLAKDDWDGMAFLYEHSPLPIFADESCVSTHDVAKCATCFHGINIKLTKCSGITPALQMITEARGLGLKVMLGSMNETMVGSAAIAHLSPLADYLDADGTLLLQENIGTGLSIIDGKVQVGEGFGLGVQMPMNF